MKMKNIYSLVVIALSVATFSGCNEDSTPTVSNNRPVAQPGSAVRQEATQQQVTPPQSGEQPAPVAPVAETEVATIVAPVQNEVVENVKTEGSNSDQNDEGVVTPEETKEEAGLEAQTDEAAPVIAPNKEQTQPATDNGSGWYETIFGTKVSPAPKGNGPKYKLAEGEQYLQIHDLDGKRASRSDLDLTNGNIYLHCEHEQAGQAPFDFLVSRAEFEKQKLEGDLVESETGDVSMIVDDNLDGQKVSVQLACTTLSRS